MNRYRQILMRMHDKAYQHKLESAMKKNLYKFKAHSTVYDYLWLEIRSSFSEYLD